MLNPRSPMALMNGGPTTALDSGIGQGGGRFGRAAPWLLLAVFFIPPLVCELVLAIAPNLAVYALYGAATALVQFKSFAAPGKRRLGGVLALVLGLMILHLVPWNTRKVFLAQFNRIEPGMSVEQVHSLLAPVSIAPERQPDRGQRVDLLHAHPW